MHATDPTPFGALGANELPVPSGIDGVVLIPRQRGHHMQAVPSRDEFMRNARHDDAGRRNIGIEMRTNNKKVQQVS
ncbi:unannotated protein [freshwater metagenome]|uniref:Unannotated protein n=1 Tax=freshwater metagenome TaxID=449393 RepID=A0A6J6I4Y8_9ZZZZ